MGPVGDFLDKPCFCVGPFFVVRLLFKNLSVMFLKRLVPSERPSLFSFRGAFFY